MSTYTEIWANLRRTGDSVILVGEDVNKRFTLQGNSRKRFGLNLSTKIEDNSLMVTVKSPVVAIPPFDDFGVRCYDAFTELGYYDQFDIEFDLLMIASDVFSFYDQSGECRDSDLVSVIMRIISSMEHLRMSPHKDWTLINFSDDIDTIEITDTSREIFMKLVVPVLNAWNSSTKINIVQKSLTTLLARAMSVCEYRGICLNDMITEKLNELKQYSQSGGVTCR